MSYDVAIDPKAAEYLKKLDKATSERILKSLWKLKEKPRTFGKVLVGINLWVLRVGDYRILYEIIEKDRKVRIFFIGHRKNIYRKI